MGNKEKDNINETKNEASTMMSMTSTTNIATISPVLESLEPGSDGTSEDDVLAIPDNEYNHYEEVDKEEKEEYFFITSKYDDEDKGDTRAVTENIIEKKTDRDTLDDNTSAATVSYSDVGQTKSDIQQIDEETSGTTRNIES